MLLDKIDLILNEKERNKQDFFDDIDRWDSTSVLDKNIRSIQAHLSSSLKKSAITKKDYNDIMYKMFDKIESIIKQSNLSKEKQESFLKRFQTIKKNYPAMKESLNLINDIVKEYE
jgi:hypothetical protein